MNNKVSAGFYFQAIASFVVALAVVIIGEVSLPLASWTRAFLALGTLYLVSSAFTLAKVVRDHQDTESVLGRLDQARLERLLAATDPYQPAPAPTSPYAPFPAAG